MMRPLLPSALADKVPTAAAGQSRGMAGEVGASAAHAGAGRLRAAQVVAEHQCGDGSPARQTWHHAVRAPEAGCCGALRFHLDAQEAALADMRRNIDAWWPMSSRCRGIVMTASVAVPTSRNTAC